MECEVALEGTHEVLSCCCLTPACKQVLVANRTRNLPLTTIAHQLRAYCLTKFIPRHSVEDVLWESPVDVSDLGRRCMFKSGPLLLKGILLHLTSHSNPASRGECQRQTCGQNGML